MTSVLIHPGYDNSGPQHWQSLWQARNPAWKRVEQADWLKPVRDAWVDTLNRYIENSEAPVVLVAHSLGCLAVAQWAADAGAGSRVAAAMLVAPPDPRSPAFPAVEGSFDPRLDLRLPFPSLVVASRNDPFATLERSRAFAEAWGSRFVDAGEVGHINTASGHGPWPEGYALLEALLAEFAAG